MAIQYAFVLLAINKLCDSNTEHNAFAIGLLASTAMLVQTRRVCTQPLNNKSIVSSAMLPAIFMSAIFSNLDRDQVAKSPLLLTVLFKNLCAALIPLSPSYFYMQLHKRQMASPDLSQVSSPTVTTCKAKHTLGSRYCKRISSTLFGDRTYGVKPVSMDRFVDSFEASPPKK